MEHPLPIGTRAHHANQEWARALPDGTATVIGHHGPMADGTYDYRVRAGVDFSRATGPDNPETRQGWWPGNATIPTPTET